MSKKVDREVEYSIKGECARAKVKDIFYKPFSSTLLDLLQLLCRKTPDTTGAIEKAQFAKL